MPKRINGRKVCKVPVSSLMFWPATVKLLNERAFIENRSKSQIVEEAVLEYIKRRRSQKINID